MGDLAVKSISNREVRNTFLKHLLKDVEILDQMLREDWFEKAPIRIGAEQELAVTNLDFSPSCSSIKILEASDDPHLTSEIAQFNLELNLDPLELRENCFSQMENQLDTLLGELHDLAQSYDQQVLLTGILATINRSHLDQKYMMPYERYKLLSDLFRKWRGTDFEIHIQGRDELIAKLDSVLFEACNTSFQLHLQVPADEFVQKYNWAQQIAGPVLSIMCNSPLLLGRALWQETRIALFRQSLDTRTAFNHLRDKQARVFFGAHWLQNSVSMLFKEHIARFPQLLTKHITEDSVVDFNDGKAPALRALRIHNGTVYNWNRPCYGRSQGVAHLRIENRYVPSGPTKKDEIANLAFWVGLMEGMPEKYEYFYEWTSFDDAKDNFYRAARTGLHTCFKWFGQTITAQRLILETLLPIAEKGLQQFKVDDEEIKKYLSIIEQRALTQQTGAQWQLHNFSQIRKSYGADVSLKFLTRAMHEFQKEDSCVHEWPKDISLKSYIGMSAEKSISQIMTTDLFTVRAEESIDLVSALMDWHAIRHLPVEGIDGLLKGIVTAKDVAKVEDGEKTQVVKEVMTKNLITVGRNCKVSEAIRLMKTNKIGCLPVVKDQRIIGMITDTDLRNVGLW